MEIDAWGAASVVTKLALYGASFLSAGAALFLIAFGEKVGALEVGLRRTIVIAAIAAAAASILLIATQAGMLAGDGVAGMAAPTMLSLLWSTQAGDAINLRLIGLALLVIAVAASRGLFIAIASLGALAIASSFALVGHASNGGGPWLQGAITLHLLVVAFWIGALPPLRSAAHGSLDLAQASDLADRFGRIAAWAVPALAIAGVISAAVLLKSPAAIFDNTYAQTLALKVAVFLVLLSLAAINKLRLVPSMQRGDQSAARRLVQSINVEIALMAAVLFLSASLTSVLTPPM